MLSGAQWHGQIHLDANCAVLLLAHYLYQESQGEHTLHETLTESRETLVQLLGLDEQTLSEIISQADEMFASDS